MTVFLTRAEQLFATSKDVSIGPVAVMSLTVGRIIQHVEAAHPNVWEGPQIATTVAFICGFIVLLVGLLRLGWLVELIPAPAVSGFMTGSAISIAAGQVPGLLGEKGFEYVPFTMWAKVELTGVVQHASGDVQSYHQLSQIPTRDEA